MRTVHKVVLPRQPEFEIRLPLNATILSLQEQMNEPSLWFHCDPKEERIVVHTFRVCGTGHEAPALERCDYVGTAVLEGGNFVLHYFMDKR